MTTLYHGSNKKFDKFELQENAKNGTDMGYGIYLTDSKDRANRYGKYQYEVSLTNDPKNREISADSVTLSNKEVTKLVEAIAKKQIETEEYPYILSDYDEPTSETEIDEGNHMIAQEIAGNILDSSKDDIDVINDLANELGGGYSASEELNPILNKAHIHYAVRDFALVSGDKRINTKEYVVFNPKDTQITSRTEIEPEKAVAKNAQNKELAKKAALQRKSGLERF